MTHEAMTLKDVRAWSLDETGKPVISLLRQEPKDLWPSGRGAEIGVIFTTLEKVIRALAKHSSKLDRPPGAILHSEENLCALILWGLSGEKAVTLISEPDIDPSHVAVIADLNANPEGIARAIRGLLGQQFLVRRTVH